MNPSLQELVSAYADGELKGREKKRIQDAIRRDPEVSEFYQSIIMIKSQLAKLPRFQLPDHFSETVMSQIQPPKNREPSLSSSAKDSRFPDSPSETGQAEKTASEKNDKSAFSGESLFLRLTNPRIWLYPLLALIVCFLVPALRERSETSPTPSTSETVSEISESSPETFADDSDASPKIVLRLKTPVHEKTLRDLNLFLDAWTPKNHAVYALNSDSPEPFIRLTLPASTQSEFLEALRNAGFSIRNSLPNADSSAPVEIEIAQKADDCENP